MTTELATYEGFDGDLVDQLEKHAREITATQEAVRRISAEGVLKIGKRLALAQELLANKGNGTFVKWIEDRLGMSFKSAYRAIEAAGKFGEFVNLTSSFDASAMYLLAADSTPDDVFQAAIELAEKGEKVTHKIAKQLVREAAGEPDEAEPWTMLIALDKADEALQRLEKNWPAESIKAFGNFLIDRGNDLLNYGELPK